MEWISSAKASSIGIEITGMNNLSDLIKSITPSFFIDAVDSTGNSVTQFPEPINISYDYSTADLTNIDEESLKFYNFNEETDEWESLTTILDTTTKTASAETNHFSQFALMGEVKDLIAPVTEAIISGDNGQDNWYRSNVSLELKGEDNEDGIGLKYTLYTLNENDWLEYSLPLVFEEEGYYKISYQSHDNADNIEERKTVEFNIDKTLPQILSNTPLDGGSYILNQNAIIDFSCSDNNSGIDSCVGQKLNGENLDTSSVGIKTFIINAADNAGNNFSKTVSYKVQYVNSVNCISNPGHIVLQPINTDGTSIFKQGSTIPVKFRVCDINGNSINTNNLVAGFNLVKTVSGTISSVVNESAVLSAAESNFRYDNTNLQWIFNLSTKNLSANKTYFYKIGLNDLSNIDFSFGLR